MGITNYINPYLILSISYFSLAIIYFIHAGLNIPNKFIVYLQNNHNILLYLSGISYIFISLTYVYSFYHYKKHNHTHEENSDMRK